MDHDEGQQVSTFMCMPSQPSCLILLLTSGLIYHCIFMPNTKYGIYDSSEVCLINRLAK